MNGDWTVTITIAPNFRPSPMPYARLAGAADRWADPPRCGLERGVTGAVTVVNLTNFAPAPYPRSPVRRQQLTDMRWSGTPYRRDRRRVGGVESSPSWMETAQIAPAWHLVEFVSGWRPWECRSG
jgi:hypothetical protein